MDGGRQERPGQVRDSLGGADLKAPGKEGGSVVCPEWARREDTMLGAVSQAQRHSTYLYLLVCGHAEADHTDLGGCGGQRRKGNKCSL